MSSAIGASQKSERIEDYAEQIQEACDDATALSWVSMADEDSLRA